jgi:hypothetical protein
MTQDYYGVDWIHVALVNTEVNLNVLYIGRETSNFQVNCKM